jgi:hypothetical protein
MHRLLIAHRASVSLLFALRCRAVRPIRAFACVASHCVRVQSRLLAMEDLVKTLAQQAELSQTQLRTRLKVRCPIRTAAPAVADLQHAHVARVQHAAYNIQRALGTAGGAHPSTAVQVPAVVQRLVLHAVQHLSCFMVHSAPTETP